MCREVAVTRRASKCQHVCVSAVPRHFREYGLLLETLPGSDAKWNLDLGSSVAARHTQFVLAYPACVSASEFGSSTVPFDGVEYDAVKIAVLPRAPRQAHPALADPAKCPRFPSSTSLGPERAGVSGPAQSRMHEQPQLCRVGSHSAAAARSPRPSRHQRLSFPDRNAGEAEATGSGAYRLNRGRVHQEDQHGWIKTSGSQNQARPRTSDSIGGGRLGPCPVVARARPRR